MARLSRTHAVALAWATRGEVGFAEQLYRMNTASSVTEFDAAVSLRQAPNYSFIAADAGGALLYAHLGRVRGPRAYSGRPRIPPRLTSSIRREN